SPARVRQGEVEEPVLPVAAEKSPSASVWQDTGVSPLSGTVTETMAQPSFATDGEAVSAYPFEHFARLREEPVTADSDRSNHESPKHVAAPAAHAQPRTSDRQSQLPSSQSGTSKDESGDTTSAHQKANENYPFSEFGKLDSQGKEKSGDE
ncbi:MAG: hypothetical protein OEZ23_09300, partial [Gammaproteobacteria bacterium]|nr:hypothetical protein [Gammaproteobacteria bacterium]